MIYTFLISIVFIAELIIAITLFSSLLQLDKRILNINSYTIQLSDKIKDIAELIKKISEQWVILSEEFVKNIKRDNEEFVLRKFSKFLLSLFVLKLNIRLIKKLQKSKITKFLVKSWLFIGNMV